MRVWIGATICSVLLLGGCEGGFNMRPTPAPAPAPAPKAVPPDAKAVAEAFARLNKLFQDEYESILAERGTRAFRVDRGASFDALQAGLVRLGMIVENRDRDLGIISVAAPAPKPLSGEEWQKTMQADLPMMGAVLCPVLGDYCRQIKFEPEDYVVVINATVREAAAGGSEVSLTTRLREIAPRPGVPRRDYPPPTAVRMALDKIWAAFNQALAAPKQKSAN